MTGIIDERDKDGGENDVRRVLYQGSPFFRYRISNLELDTCEQLFTLKIAG